MELALINMDVCCKPNFRKLYFFFSHLMATVNWLTILPLFGCAHKNLNILRRNKVKFVYSAKDVYTSLIVQIKTVSFKFNDGAEP
jgi:hypothetical protein